MRSPRVLAWTAAGLVAVAIGAWQGGHVFHRSPAPVAVAQPDASPVAVIVPDAGQPMDAAPAHVAVTAAVPDASPPRSKSPPRVAEKPRHGAVAFAELITKWVPPESVPQALGIVADVCDQDRVLTDDASAHFREDEANGKPWDKAADLAVARAIRDSQRDAMRALAALPGSRFDKAAWLELVATPSFKNDCLHQDEKDDDDE